MPFRWSGEHPELACEPGIPQPALVELAPKIKADSTRKQAVENLVDRVIAHAKKMNWTVRKTTELPFDISIWTTLSINDKGFGEDGVRKNLHLWRLEEIVEKYMSDATVMCLWSVRVTYDVKDNVERASVSFKTK